MAVCVRTAYPLASDSPDHLHPKGTALDNSSNRRFNQKLYTLYRSLGRPLRILDLGCAGGAFVRECLSDGHIAVGIEGSDYSRRWGRAEWPMLGGRALFTADVARPFEVVRLEPASEVAAVVAFMGLVSTWLPFLSSQIMQRWFDSSNFLWLSPVPLAALVNAVLLWRAVRQRREIAPLILALCFFGLGFAGLLLGVWPNLLPPDLSIWEAAAPPSSQGFVLVGTLLMLPAVLGYTWWSYSVFRGKVAAESGYH